MANQNISGLPDATLPLVSTDKFIVSRDGVTLNDATLGDLTEVIQDIVGATLAGAANSTITVTYNDAAGTITIGRSEPIIAFTTRALAATDNFATLVPSDAAQTMTINTGLPAGFGCFVTKNATVVQGSSATVTDNRTAGATNPSFAVVCVGTDSYVLVGTKT